MADGGGGGTVLNACDWDGGKFDGVDAGAEAKGFAFNCGACAANGDVVERKSVATESPGSGLLLGVDVTIVASGCKGVSVRFAGGLKMLICDAGCEGICGSLNGEGAGGSDVGILNAD